MDIKRKQNQMNEIFEQSAVVLAYLFGSAAKDKIGPLSDMDIAVLFSVGMPRSEQLKKESAIAYALEKLFDVKETDIVNLGAVDNILLRYNAVFNGKPIFVKDQKIRLMLERNILREYEDTRHLREIQSFYLRKHIKEGAFGKPKFRLKSKYAETYVSG